ncbi:MAG: heavy-metal-associated domain-containing protein [Planctomycetales bacterium]|nr:heavy-metal-associated domain-containing protein [Planctomycetales bacterium]
MLRDPGTALPESARRRAGDRAYWAWRAEGLSHVVQRRPDGRLCVLTAALPEQDLADLVVGADAGRAAPRASTRSLRLRVAGMSCSLCAGVARAALEASPGVARAVVSYPDGTAVVDLADGADPATVREALARAGFDAEESR